MKKIDDLKSLEDVITALEDLCLTMQKHKLLNSNSEANFEAIEKNKVITENFIKSKLQELDSNEAKILFLESIIEYMFIDPTDLALKEKLVSLGEEYYKNILDKADQLAPEAHVQEGKSSEKDNNKKPIKENNEEIRFLELIRGTKAKIYEDKDKEERYSYGELLENHRVEPEIIYDDKGMIFTRRKTYETHKLANSDKGKISNLETKKVCKYSLELTDDSARAKVDFFADPEIGDAIKSGDLRYFSPVFAAILKAKDAGKNYIGTINMIDEELKTFVTKYDENLEAAIKRLKEKSDKAIKEESPSIDDESKDIR